MSVVGIPDVDDQRGQAEQDDDDEDEGENEHLTSLLGAGVCAVRRWGKHLAGLLDPARAAPPTLLLLAHLSAFRGSHSPLGRVIAPLVALWAGGGAAVSLSSGDSLPLPRDSRSWKRASHARADLCRLLKRAEGATRLLRQRRRGRAACSTIRTRGAEAHPVPARRRLRAGPPS